jgi:hypothetical protein
MRHQIDQILEELWRDERCRECIRQHATASAAAAAAGSGGAPGGVFATFVKAVLGDLMYLFKDSLERLASMKQIEDSKADAAVSSRLQTVFMRIISDGVAASYLERNITIMIRLNVVRLQLFLHDDLMYLFKDRLERLASMKRVEDSKADAAVSGCLLNEFMFHVMAVSLVAASYLELNLKSGMDSINVVRLHSGCFLCLAT